jgi:predicted GNAT family acetyltransferase
MRAEEGDLHHHSHSRPTHFGRSNAARTFAVMTKKAATPTRFVPAELELHDEPHNRQFAARVDGLRATVEYDRDGERIFLTGLRVPPALQPLGVGDALLEKVLCHVEERKWKLIPTNPAIKDYLRTHSAWQRLLLKGVQLR